jgi:hypothetical protein
MNEQRSDKLGLYKKHVNLYDFFCKQINALLNFMYINRPAMIRYPIAYKKQEKLLSFTQGFEVFNDLIDIFFCKLVFVRLHES